MDALLVCYVFGRFSSALFHQSVSLWSESSSYRTKFYGSSSQLSSLAACHSWHQTHSGPPFTNRLPITDDLMLRIWKSLNLQLPDHCMFWAACTLGYFGFLRSAEFTVPSWASFSPSVHLGAQDLAVDSSLAPSCICVTIKASKTDPFRKGCSIHIGLGKYPLCAVHALLAYLAIQGDGPGPLFLCQNGQPLSRTLLTNWLRQIMASAGISGNFSSHSFRIGAATVAGRNGIPDHLIQELGQWKSNAF